MPVKATENFGLFVADYTQSSAAGTAAPSFVFINPANSGEYYKIIEVTALFDVAGGAAAAADVLVVPKATALSAGTSALSATIDLTTGARTSKKSTLSATAGNLIVPPGSSVAVNTSGTLTGLTGLVVQVILKPLRGAKGRF